MQQEEEFFDLDKADYGLVPVHCDVWAGFIFVNLDDTPRWSLPEFLARVPPSPSPSLPPSSPSPLPPPPPSPPSPLSPPPFSLPSSSATDQMIENQRVDNATWNELADHFDDTQLLELLFVAGSYLCFAVIVNSARLEPDPPTEPVDAPVLPGAED